MTLPETRSISVVVPTFNDVGRLGEALTSIVGQTLPPGEVVVADDGSDDGTDEFVAEFSAGQANGVAVRYVRLSSRSGVVAARNEGIALAHGEWIATCDSDDVWAPSKLERQAAFVRDWRGGQPIALLGTYGYNVNDAKRVISIADMGPTSEEEYSALRRAGGTFFMLHSSVMYPRADYLAVGGYTTEYRAADDVHFFCQMAERGVVISLPEPLVYYRKRAGSVQMSRFWDQRRGVLRLTENQQRRAAGEAPIGSDEFDAQMASDPALKRLRRRRQLWGVYYYRVGAAHIVNGRRLRGGLELALASVMDGARLRSGIRHVLRVRPSRASRALPAAEREAP
ncbi:MAG TPA: glycosyltransferase family 2 protein [Solirubrobacteraceae bacterium]|jgi:glycosyltransferase involved in cell wall biosynthesis|nr:glycosyltransferase family 2 protein [Solirubrobacteraceae bacterium]